MTNILTKNYNVALAGQYKLPNIDEALLGSDTVVSQDFWGNYISVEVGSCSSVYSTQGKKLFSHGY